MGMTLVMEQERDPVLKDLKRWLRLDPMSPVHQHYVILRDILKNVCWAWGPTKLVVSQLSKFWEYSRNAMRRLRCTKDF